MNEGMRLVDVMAMASRSSFKGFWPQALLYPMKATLSLTVGVFCQKSDLYSEVLEKVSGV